MQYIVRPCRDVEAPLALFAVWQLRIHNTQRCSYHHLCSVHALEALGHAGGWHTWHLVDTAQVAWHSFATTWMVHWQLLLAAGVAPMPVGIDRLKVVYSSAMIFHSSRQEWHQNSILRSNTQRSQQTDKYPACVAGRKALISIKGRFIAELKREG